MEKRIGMRLFAALATMAGLLAAAAPAQADVGTNVTTYRFINAHSGKCLTPTGPNPNALVVQRGCNGSDAQRWYRETRASGFEQFRNFAYPSQCMDLVANSEAEVHNGTLVQQFWCSNDYPSEEWWLAASDRPGYQMLVTRIHSLCGDIVNRSSSDNAKLQIYGCKSWESAQQFLVQVA